MTRWGWVGALAAVTSLTVSGCALDLATGPGEVTLTEGSDPAPPSPEQAPGRPGERTVRADIEGDGIWLVGPDIKPGIYVAPDAPGCYWERLSGLSGEFADLITNSNVSGQAVVEVRKSDTAFSSSGCGTWVKVSKVPKAPQQSVHEDGVWLVGRQLAPGTYRSPGGSGCYWERLSGLSGDFEDLIVNRHARGPSVVEIKPTDAGFSTTGCGIWRRIG